MPRLGSFSNRSLTGISLNFAPAGPPPTSQAMIIEARLPNDVNQLSNLYIKIAQSCGATVDWGDGIVQTLNSGYSPITTHDYTTGNAQPGDTVTITISGNLVTYGGWQIGMGSGQGQHFITRVLQWNSATINLDWAFEGEQLLTEVPSTLPVGVTSTRGMFWDCSSFDNTAMIFTSDNGDFYSTWFGAYYFSIGGLSYGFQQFLEAGGIAPGNKVILSSSQGQTAVRTVTLVNYFAGNDYCDILFEEVDSGNFDVSSFIALQSNSISSWDVSSVTDMSYMFEYCTLMNAYLGSWDVSSVTNMAGMFKHADQYRGLGIGKWDVSNVTNMSRMFFATGQFNESIGVWNVGNVTDMSYMFEYAQAFNQPIGGWNTANVSDMTYMFNNTPSFNQNLTGWSVPLITDGAVTGFFLPGYTAQGVHPIWGSTQTPLIVTFNGAFADLYFFQGNGLIPNGIIEWGDGKKTVIPYGGGGGYTHDYVDESLSPVEGLHEITVRGYLPNMQGGTIYYGSPVYPTTTGMTKVSQWNSTMVNLSGAFEHRTALTSVPNYLPPSVTTTNAMFIETASFNDNNVCQWDVSNVTSMYGMFSDSLAFNQDLSTWNVSQIQDDQWTNGGYGSNPAGILDNTKWPIWGTNGSDTLTSEYLYAYTHTPGNFPSTISFTLDAGTGANAFRASITTRAINTVYIRDTSQNLAYKLVLDYTDYGSSLVESVGSNQVRITFVETNVAVSPNPNNNPISATFTGNIVGKVLR